VTINVGQDFKKRWLKAPDAVRQAFIDDLSRISDLLEPKTQLDLWLDQDNRAKQVAQLKTEQAYAAEKARLIEAARVRKQLALEKSLADKRAQQEAYNQQLIQDEYLKFQQQTESLTQLKSLIDTEINLHTEKYDQVKPTIHKAPVKLDALAQTNISNDLDTIRLRLELEAETMIDDALKLFREKLKVAAEEEINLIIKNSKFD
jgi:hypothetical protein